MEYRSNGGKGPLRAKIIANDGTTVMMVRWEENSVQRHEHFFNLPVGFLDSPRCGWKRVPRGSTTGLPAPVREPEE